MVGDSPEEAVDAFIGPLRQTLGCVVRGTVIASGGNQDEGNAVTLFPEGQAGGEPARMRTHGGEGELLLRFAQQYHVAQVAGNRAPGPFRIRTSFYRYDVLTRDGAELVVFHWEPSGRSPVRTPHLHLPAAAPITLPQRAGSGVAKAKTYLNRLHLPTGHILPEDVVELPIRDFATVPLNADWEAVLAEKRAAFQHGRDWQ